jgi:hypothetical protein
MLKEFIKRNVLKEPPPPEPPHTATVVWRDGVTVVWRDGVSVV